MVDYSPDFHVKLWFPKEPFSAVLKIYFFLTVNKCKGFSWNQMAREFNSWVSEVKTPFIFLHMEIDFE